MTFLPVVERELRVASRKKATYWTRFFLALGVFAIWLVVLVDAPASIPLARGEMVFAALSVLALVYSLLAGVFLTADSISGEKREGTLGLLFLTELKGHDVVLGKLIGTSVHAFYGLLAIFPLLAYSMLVGGVTAGEFWRTVIALAATMVFSLSVGMLISAICSETRQAMGTTLFVMGLLTFLLPAFVGLAGLILQKSPLIFLMWPCPACVCAYAFDAAFYSPAGRMHFICSLLTMLVLAASALLAAGVYIERTWRRKQEMAEQQISRLVTREFKYGSQSFRRGRIPLLEANPFQWLIGRDCLPKLTALRTTGCLFLVWLLCSLGCLVSQGSRKSMFFSAAVVVAYGLHHTMKWFFAMESSRRLSEDRHSGALELLLVTPVTIENIIHGQRLALRSMFFLPTTLAIGANLGLVFLTAARNPAGLSPQSAFIFCEIVLGGAVLLLIDRYALTWVGMWTALLTKRHVRAIMSTLGRVMLTPVLVVGFLILMTIGGRTLTLDTALAVSPVWIVLGGVIKYTFASRAKIGLVETMRQISSGVDLRAREPDVVDQAQSQSLSAQAQA